MVFGNSINFKGIGLVAFIDILGFSKEIYENWETEINNPLENILKLKRHLPIFKNEIIEKIKLDSGSNTYVPRVQTISDSIIVSFGFDENIGNGNKVLSIISFFDTIAVIWHWALQMDFTIRGAIDFDKIFWNESEIIGPAFINAYRCESIASKTSRIILSSNSNKFIYDLLLNAHTLHDQDLLECMKKDIDGYIIFNPHRLYFNSESKTQLISKLNQLKSNANNIAKEKYSPLLAVLSSEDIQISIEDLGKY